MAIMGVSSTDWSDVEQLAAARPQHVVSAFGVHPWKAHLHAGSSCVLASAATVADTLDQSRLDEAQRAALPVKTQKPLVQVWLLPSEF